MAGTNRILGGGGFHHVAMKARHFDASVRFYEDVLGLRRKVAWGEGDRRAVMLDTGDGACIEIFCGGDGEPKPDGHWLHIALWCQDVDGVTDRVRRAGMEVTVEPKDVHLPSEPPLTLRASFFRGPDGELIELLQER